MSAPPKNKTASKSKKTSAGKSIEHPALAVCRSLAKLVETYSLSEISLDTEELTVKVKRESKIVMNAAQTMIPNQSAAPSPVVVESSIAPEAQQHHEVTSPFVGTFYRSPSPESSPYCTVGQRVEAGQVLCIVEAMKLMNEIEADVSGIIEAVLVENAEPVEYGQPLFQIK